MIVRGSLSIKYEKNEIAFAKSKNGDIWKIPKSIWHVSVCVPPTDVFSKWVVSIHLNSSHSLSFYIFCGRQSDFSNRLICEK